MNKRWWHPDTSPASDWSVIILSSLSLVSHYSESSVSWQSDREVQGIISSDILLACSPGSQALMAPMLLGGHRPQITTLQLIRNRTESESLWMLCKVQIWECISLICQFSLIITSHGCCIIYFTINSSCAQFCLAGVPAPASAPV